MFVGSLALLRRLRFGRRRVLSLVIVLGRIIGVGIILGFRVIILCL
jgi:hypothetical protein